MDTPEQPIQDIPIPENKGDFVYKHLTLSLPQQVAILKMWNDNPKTPPSTIELIKVAWPESTATARDFEGRAIKAFLATRSLKTRMAADYIPKKPPVLTDEQKQFITNNAGKFTSKNQAAEIAQIVFNNPNITNLNLEARVVDEFLATVPSIVKYKSEVPKEDYTPPNTPDRAIARVNKYVLNGIDRNKITPQIKKNIDALIRYLHTASFLRQINDYPDQSDRDCFEDHFLRYVFDKQDLTQEESDSYIALANEKVISANIQKTINNIQKEIDNTVKETGKVPVSLVDLISSVREGFNASSSRQLKLLNDLKVKRSDRIQAKTDNGASITYFFDMWREQETRLKIIKMNELNRQALEKDIDNLMSMDEIICRVNGINKEEIMNG